MADRSPSPLLTVDAEGIAWITFADPDRRMNVLDEGVMRRLEDHLERIRGEAREGTVRAVVIFSGKPDSFIAGADIDAIGALEGPDDAEAKARMGQEAFQALRDLPLPTVAGIHGICLGGGLELSLACRHRVASSSPKTKLGLPEVQLGLLPGWGGTTRLPRLVGIRSALDMLLTGKQLKASSAKRAGLVDEVLPPEGFREGLRRFALRARDGKVEAREDPGLVDRALASPLARPLVLRAARKRVMKETGGHYPAPLKILEVLGEALSLPVDQSLVVEARAFGALAATSAHRNLLHLFKLREEARKTDRILPGATPRSVERMGVLGAGVMGGGIAQLAAYNRIHVRMKDIRDDAVASGLEHAAGLFRKRVERKRMTRREMDAYMGHITGTLDYQGFGGLDLVVEAVVERMEVKQAVLRETEGVVGPDCVLATNTSSLSVDEMSSVLERPENFCGMHFFNPVHRMPLVEVVRGAATSPDVVATVHALSVRLGKVPVVCNDGPGFLVNRILGPYLNEAGHLLMSGASIRAVDRAAKEFGMPMGPVRLLDEVGIDVARHAGATLHEAFGERMAPSPVLERLGETDRLGKKNGRGFYLYENGKEKEVDESVYEDLGLPVPGEDELSQEVIRRRLILAMINEAARILSDGVVTRAEDVDLGMIMGTGFPPFRGGLLRFADDEHLRAILERTRELESELGARFAPAPLLVELARDNRTFYDAFGGGRQGRQE